LVPKTRTSYCIFKEQVPAIGSCFGAQIWLIFGSRTKVYAFWHWINWAKQRAVTAHKEPLLLNLDETSVCYSYGGAKGFVTRKTRAGLQPQEDVNRAEMRGAATHVALISERTDIQPLLPQVIITNKRRFPVRLVTHPEMPANVHVLREKTAWNTTVVMCKILELIAAALLAFPTLQPILLLDTASCHIQPEVARQANRLGIILCIIPAGLTWMLQPLDTHGFAGYKQWLRNSYRSVLSEHARISSEQWLIMFFGVATSYLSSKQWAPVFAAVGCSEPRKALSKDLRAYVPDHEIMISATELTVQEFKLVFPKRHKIRPWLFTGRRRRLVLFSHGVPVAPAHAA
jgi:hypothetical protein